MRPWFVMLLVCAPALAAGAKSSALDSLQGLDPGSQASAAVPAVNAQPAGVAHTGPSIPACAARAAQARKPPVWRTALLIFKTIDARYTDRNDNKLHACGASDENTLAAAERAYRAFGPLAERLSQGAIKVETEVVEVPVNEPLKRIDLIKDNDNEARDDYWVPPDAIVEPVMKNLSGGHDSLFVVWPIGGGRCADVRMDSFGRGTFLDAPPQRTYASLALTTSDPWKTPTVGEPFLHEWLHGVARFFLRYGYVMPKGDADGGGSHGYTQGSQGWVPFYSDLMTANVTEGSAKTGIPREAWLCGTPTDAPRP